MTIANNNYCVTGTTQAASQGNCPNGYVKDGNTCRQLSGGTYSAATPASCPVGFTPKPNANNIATCEKETTANYVPATDGYCTVDGTVNGDLNEGQCNALSRNGDNGPPTQWVENVSFFQDINTAKAVMDDDANFIAGIIGGYNVQRDRTVFGFEGDIGRADEMNSMHSSSYSEVDADMDAIDYVNGVNVDLPQGQGLDPSEFGLNENSPTSIETNASADMGLSGFGTLRARLGRTFHDDRLLAFVTGGVAFGKISTKGSVTYSGTLDDGNPETNDSFSETHQFGDSQWELGWTAGAGVNYLIGERAVLGLTYLYTDLGKHSFSDSFEASSSGTGAWGSPDDYSAVSGGVKGSVDARFHTIRASFTILFN